MPKKVFYWETALSQNPEEFEGCEKQINALLGGDYQTADLDTKKLRDYKLYTARINDADRLLFTTIIINGSSHLLLLEIIKSHDYHKSKYLNNPNSLKKFFHSEFSDEAPLRLHITEASFEESKEPILDNLEFTHVESKSISPSLDYNPTIYYQEKFILLNEDQEKTKNAALPLIVSGPPGSGKSCVALTILKQQLLRSHLLDTQQPLLYVSRSPRLVRHMQKLADELLELSEDQKQLYAPVEFMTYEELIAATPIENQESIIAEDFNNWYKAQSDLSKNLLKSYSVEMIYQELHIAASVADEKEFLEIGKKNSLLGEAPDEIKQQLYVLFENYRSYLVNNQLINLDFYEPQQFPMYQAIVADESQDFTPLQLRNLFRMATNQQVAYCLDTHQSLIARKSNLPYLIRLTKKDPIKLSLPYRSGKNIIALANTLITLKNNLVGGMAVKDEIKEIAHNSAYSRPKGVIHCYPLQDESREIFKKIQCEYKETEIAVVAWPNYFDEARKYFDTPLLFTPDQVKGLEYKVVIAYRPFDQDIFENANSKLRQIDIKDIKSRPKGGADDQYGPAFNQLFTVTTRAIERIIFLQDKTHKNEILTATLTQHVTKEEIATYSSLHAESKSTSREEWDAQAKKLLQAGHEGQARDIFLNKLGKTSEEFNVLKSFSLSSSLEMSPMLPSNSQSNLSGPAYRKAVHELKIKNQNIDKDVVKFLTKVTYQNIENLFLKTKYLNDILFARQKNGVFIFHYLLLEHTEIMTRLFAKNNEYIQLIDCNFMTKAFVQPCSYLLSGVDAGSYHRTKTRLLTALIFNAIPLLNLLIKNHIALNKKPHSQHHKWVSDYEWFKMYVSTENERVNPFSKLIESEDGIEILSIILEMHPNFAIRLNGNQLQWTHLYTDDLLPTHFPLLSLTKTAKGNVVLDKLFELNSQLIHEITATSLCHEASNTSIFNQLRQTEQGSALLTKLLKTNLALVSQFAAYPEKFFLLLQDKLFTKLVSANPDVVKRFNSGILTQTLINYSFSKQAELLDQIFAINPQLTVDITSEVEEIIHKIFASAEHEKPVDFMCLKLADYYLNKYYSSYDRSWLGIYYKYNTHQQFIDKIRLPQNTLEQLEALFQTRNDAIIFTILSYYLNENYKEQDLKLSVLNFILNKCFTRCLNYDALATSYGQRIQAMILNHLFIQDTAKINDEELRRRLFYYFDQKDHASILRQLLNQTPPDQRHPGLIKIINNENNLHINLLNEAYLTPYGMQNRTEIAINILINKESKSEQVCFENVGHPSLIKYISQVGLTLTSGEKLITFDKNKVAFFPLYDKNILSLDDIDHINNESLEYETLLELDVSQSDSNISAISDKVLMLRKYYQSPDFDFLNKNVFIPIKAEITRLKGDNGHDKADQLDVALTEIKTSFKRKLINGISSKSNNTVQLNACVFGKVVEIKERPEINYSRNKIKAFLSGIAGVFLALPFGLLPLFSRGYRLKFFRPKTSKALSNITHKLNDRMTRILN